MVGYETIDVPTLRVDPAVWEPSDLARGRMTAHLRLGDVAVRLEAIALDLTDETIGTDGPVQYMQILDRRYRVTAYDESLVGAVA